jgi:adenine-specific DNA-methyltransferase
MARGGRSLVRQLCDEVFGNSNFCRQISVTKTAGFGATPLPVTQDYVVWYAKNLKVVKFHQLYGDKVPGIGGDDALIYFGNYKKIDREGNGYASTT